MVENQRIRAKILIGTLILVYRERGIQNRQFWFFFEFFHRVLSANKFLFENETKQKETDSLKNKKKTSWIKEKLLKSEWRKKPSEQQIKESIKNQPTIERIVNDESNNNFTVQLWVWIFLRDTTKNTRKKKLSVFYIFSVFFFLLFLIYSLL